MTHTGINRALKSAAVAVLALGITCAATGITQAEPAPTAPASTHEIVTSAHGIDSVGSYFARMTPDGSGVATTLDSGRFTLAPDAKSVTVADTSGKAVTTLPLSLHTADRDIPLAASIEDQGATLTLRPVGAPVRDISSQDRWNEQVQRGTFGAMIGAAIGGIITIPFWIFILPPLLGIGIGAAIGFLAVGGQPLIDAGIAYFSGQP